MSFAKANNQRIYYISNRNVLREYIKAASETGLFAFVVGRKTGCDIKEVHNSEMGCVCSKPTPLAISGVSYHA